MNLPFFIAQLQTQGNAIIQLAGGLTPAQARWRPKPSDWSVLEVLNHLIGNAIRYSPDESVVTIKVSLLTAPGRIQIDVVDTGYGIAPEDQARLFTAFFRSEDPRVRQEPGWGLGLHLCSRLIQVLGGTLGLNSACDKGTTATFTLPIDAP